MRPDTLISLVVLLSLMADLRAESGADAYGRGDYANAVSRFESRAQAGDATAQNNLGVLYLKGRGVAHDYVRARALFQAASDQHLPGAMFNLGMMYLRGYGVAAEPARAADWFQRAAALDDREAQFFLAVMYAKGQGVAVNRDLAREWFEKSAKAGLPAAQFNLAMLMLQQASAAGGEAEAMKWLEAAARQDYKLAKLHIAKLDLSHNDDPQRLEHAAVLLRELADGGDPEGQMQFGLMNLFGQGLPLNEEEGRFWLRQSALQGWAAAQVNLSAVYAQGIGTHADPVQAYAWLAVAAAQDSKVKPALTEMAARLKPEQRSQGEALARQLESKRAAAASEVSETSD